MRFLSTFLMFIGWALVYASVAAGGRFATDPWRGLLTEAYDDSYNPSTGTDSAAPGHGYKSNG